MGVTVNSEVSDPPCWRTLPNFCLHLCLSRSEESAANLARTAESVDIHFH